jgi:hypothetical protein
VLLIFVETRRTILSNNAHNSNVVMDFHGLRRVALVAFDNHLRFHGISVPASVARVTHQYDMHCAAFRDAFGVQPKRRHVQLGQHVWTVRRYDVVFNRWWTAPLKFLLRTFYWMRELVKWPSHLWHDACLYARTRKRYYLASLVTLPVVCLRNMFVALLNFVRDVVGCSVYLLRWWGYVTVLATFVYGVVVPVQLAVDHSHIVLPAVLYTACVSAFALYWR